jgi:hypothetical protein
MAGSPFEPREQRERVIALDCPHQFGGGGVLPMMAGRIELLSAEHKGVNERNPRGIPYELGRLFSDTAGTTSETSINAVLSVMPQNEFALRHRLRGRAIACGC